MTDFFQAGSFLTNSPVSDIELDFQIPDFRCSECSQDSATSYYNYPHLNPAAFLSKAERKKMGPVIQETGSDNEIMEIVWRLRRKFNIAVTAGTIFGPTQLKVTTKPKWDVFVLVGHAGVFFRRAAADKLLESGLTIEYHQTPAKGKYALEANYVELVVPVKGRQKLPEGNTFCNECLRYSPGTSFKTVLLKDQIPIKDPIFKTLEGTIIFNFSFINECRRLGISGFIEGKTLLPVPVSEK